MGEHATIRLTLPLSDEQAKAVVIAADRFGVEPWEIAVHALALRQSVSGAPTKRETT